MTRLATSLLVIGILVLALAGCDPFFQFNPPNGSDGDAGDEPSGQAMFFDDFEGGAQSAWTAASGTWTVEAGLYSTEERFTDHWLNTYVKMPDSTNWDDYTIDVELKNGTWRGNNDQTVGVIIRAQDDLNRVVFLATGNDLWWNVQLDGEWRYQGKGTVSPGLTEEAHIRIQVEDDTYTAYIRQGTQGDLIKRTSFTDNTFTNGMPGLTVLDPLDVGFDSFKVSRLDD